MSFGLHVKSVKRDAVGDLEATVAFLPSTMTRFPTHGFVIPEGPCPDELVMFKGDTIGISSLQGLILLETQLAQWLKSQGKTWKDWDTRKCLLDKMRN